MKKYALSLLALILTISVSATDSDPRKTLTLEGYYLGKRFVNYEVCIINNDGSCETIKTKKTFNQYEIDLEIGKLYSITFSKGNETKELMVYAGGDGVIELDIDFESAACATIDYSDKRDSYFITVSKGDEVCQEKLTSH